jgi:hypothetical protein
MISQRLPRLFAMNSKLFSVILRPPFVKASDVDESYKKHKIKSVEPGRRSAQQMATPRRAAALRQTADSSAPSLISGRAACERGGEQNSPAGRRGKCHSFSMVHK